MHFFYGDNGQIERRAWSGSGIRVLFSGIIGIGHYVDGSQSYWRGNRVGKVRDNLSFLKELVDKNFAKRTAKRTWHYLNSFIITNEAPPQTNELTQFILHCLRRSNSGCKMLDARQMNSFSIQNPETSIRHHVSSAENHITLQKTWHKSVVCLADKIQDLGLWRHVSSAKDKYQALRLLLYCVYCCE